MAKSTSGQAGIVTGCKEAEYNTVLLRFTGSTNHDGRIDDQAIPTNSERVHHQAIHTGGT